MQLSRYLGDKVFWRTALTLGVPIALQNLLTSSLSLIDTIMVGQLGDISLSAVGMAGQFSWLMQLVMFGLSSGSAVFISQYWGARDVNGINRIHGIMLSHMFSVSLVFFALGQIIPEIIIKIFNTNPDVVKTGSEYLRIAAFSYPAVALTMTLSTVLRSTENVRLPLITSIITTAENAVLNYVLIFGKLGFSAMGIAGAALATAISAWTGVFILIVASALRRNTACAGLKELLGFKKELLFKFYKISAPAIVNESIWGLGTFCYNIIFGRLGYDVYAAMTIFRTVDGIAFTLLVGLCNACCIMIGKYIGIGQIKEALRDSKRFAVLIPIVSVVIGIGLIIFRGPIVSVFSMGDSITEFTRNTAMLFIAIYGAEYGIRNIPYIQIVGIFRPGGDTAIGLRYDGICLWGISMPLTVVAAFVLKWPAPAVFATMLLAEDIVKGIMCIRRYKSRKWLKPITQEGREALAEFLAESATA